MVILKLEKNRILVKILSFVKNLNLIPCVTLRICSEREHHP